MGDVLLAVEGLSKHFGGIAATDDVSLAVEHGELHAVIGPNGAGKTTLIHQLTGAIRPDRGRILFRGGDITRRPIHERVGLGIARSYQITSVFGGLSMLDNVALAVQARSGSSLSFWRPASDERPLLDEALQLVGELGLSGREGVLANRLAHGEQRQLEVGLALATAPRLVLLDEPLAGMSPDEVEPMIELIRQLRGRVAVLLVEHDMDAVFRLADRISVLVSGRVIATSSPEEIRQDPRVKRAYLGDEARP